MNDPVKPARKPRLTVEDAWPYKRELLVLADKHDAACILAGYRNSAEAATLRDRAARLRRDADDCETRAEDIVDLRDDVLKRLTARAAELTK